METNRLSRWEMKSGTVNNRVETVEISQREHHYHRESFSDRYLVNVIDAKNTIENVTCISIAVSQIPRKISERKTNLPLRVYYVIYSKCFQDRAKRRVVGE